jgi:hypothetical protein
MDGKAGITCMDIGFRRLRAVNIPKKFNGQLLCLNFGLRENLNSKQPEG